MESKTKKTTTKKEEVIVKNQIDYTITLNRIFYTLIVIAVISCINLCINIAVNSSSETKEVETENSEYDVSKFNTMTTDEAISKITAGDLQVIYIGRPTCGYCVKFVPVLKQAQEDLGYTTTYINLDEITSADKDKLVAYNSYIEQNFGYTPMVLVFKNGKYVDGTVGYSEIAELKSFLADAGIK